MTQLPNGRMKLSRRDFASDRKRSKGLSIGILEQAEPEIDIEPTTALALRTRGQNAPLMPYESRRHGAPIPLIVRRLEPFRNDQFQTAS